MLSKIINPEQHLKEALSQGLLFFSQSEVLSESGYYIIFVTLSTSNSIILKI